MDINLLLNNEDTVFHYTKSDKAIENIIFEKRLKFSTSIGTNDPREYKDWDFNSTYNICLPNTPGNPLAELEQLGARRRELNKIMKSEFKFACFCLNKPTSKGYEKMRMWAQYGGNFYGICFAFSKKALQGQLWNLLGKKRVFSGNVRYVKDISDHDHPDRWLDGNDFSNDAREYADRYLKNRGRIKRIFFVKHIDYRDENEFRFVVRDPDNSFEDLDISDSIKAVLLGERFKEVYKPLVGNFIVDLDIPCKKAIWHCGGLSFYDLI